MGSNMGRPIYETEADVGEEEQCGRMLTALGHTVLSLPKFSSADFILKTALSTYLVEFKVRNHIFGTYPTAILPAEKVNKLIFTAKSLNLKVMYLCRYEDGYYATLLEDFTVKMGGRTDRNDPQDIYPMAHIPIEEFRPFGQ